MEKKLLENINVQIPVTIGYEVLEKLMRERMIGETIQVEKENGEVTRYARVLDVAFGRSIEEEYDITVVVEFRLLTTLFKNKVAGILFDAVLHYDEEEQLISVADYKIRGNSKSWLINRSLKAIANNFIYKKLKSKMKLDFRPHIEPQLKKLNAKLENDFEAAKGVLLSGRLNDVKIDEIIPREKGIFLLLSVQGGTAVEITSLDI